MPYDSANVLDEESPSICVIERVCFIDSKAKGNACRYFEITGEDVDLVLHAQVVIEDVTVKIAELRGLSF